MENSLSKEHQDLILEELKELENQRFELEGKEVKPSQCYRWESNPAHLLFNTNCPQDLKKQLDLIISKYLPEHEGRTS